MQIDPRDLFLYHVSHNLWIWQINEMCKFAFTMILSECFVYLGFRKSENILMQYWEYRYESFILQFAI